MARRHFGQRNELYFQSDEEYYEALGYLANPNSSYYITCEEYANKWGAEYRINFYSISNMPQSLQNALSAGNNTYVARLNNNDYIHTLIHDYNFSTTGNQILRDILDTIPPRHLESFNRGYEI